MSLTQVFFFTLFEIYFWMIYRILQSNMPSYLLINLFPDFMHCSLIFEVPKTVFIYFVQMALQVCYFQFWSLDLCLLNWPLLLFLATEAPRIVKEIHDLDVIEGQEAVFTCEITGMPRPEVTWYVLHSMVCITCCYGNHEQDHGWGLILAVELRNKPSLFM